MSVSLRELQENFQAYMLNQNNNIVQTLSDQESNAIDRINIYKKGYSLRLIEVLEKDFPILRQIIGEEQYEEICREYIQLHPSNHFSICTFSRHIRDFLLNIKNEPFWSEISAFEMALFTALDAADAPQIGVDALSTIQAESWPYIQFDFHPSVALYKFHYNAPKIAYAHMLGEENIPEVVHNEQPTDWIIWRYNLQSYFETVTPEQVWMIENLRQEKTFAEICEGLCQWFPEEEVAQFAAGSLRNWIEKGIFATIKVAELVTEEAIV